MSRVRGRGLRPLGPACDSMAGVAAEPVLPDMVRGYPDVPAGLQADPAAEGGNATAVAAALLPLGLLGSSSLAVGIVFSAKSFMGMLSTPVVGHMVDRYVVSAQLQLCVCVCVCVCVCAYVVSSVKHAHINRVHIYM